MLGDPTSACATPEAPRRLFAFRACVSLTGFPPMQTALLSSARHCVGRGHLRLYGSDEVLATRPDHAEPIGTCKSFSQVSATAPGVRIVGLLLCSEVKFTPSVTCRAQKDFDDIVYLHAIFMNPGYCGVRSRPARTRRRRKTSQKRNVRWIPMQFHSLPRMRRSCI